MKILFTGGSGLLAANWALFIRDTINVSLALHKRAIYLERVQCFYINLESLDSISQHMAFIRPDIVVHAAALTDVDKCEFNPALAKLINTVMAINVATVCASYKCLFIHISTDHLHDGQRTFVREFEPVSPINQYGLTKAAAEAGILEVLPKALIIRTNFFWWGPWYRPSFSDWILQALRQRQQLNMFVDVYYTPISIHALIRTIELLINANAHGVYNVVSNERISKFEFGLMIANHFGLDAKLITPTTLRDTAKLVMRPLDMSLSNNKLRDSLMITLPTLDDQIAYMKQCEFTPERVMLTCL